MLTRFTLLLCGCNNSFHVGSGCQTPAAYQNALELSSEIFKCASVVGYHFSLLDIGGGFPGDKGSSELFKKTTVAINTGLETYFSKEDYPSLKIIAEPGECGDSPPVLCQLPF